MKQKLLFWSSIICLLLFMNPLGAQTVFVNEIHYDNEGGDTGEAIEIAGPTGTDLSGWSVVLYNGNNSSFYATISLSGSIPNLQGGYGTISFSEASIQNGSPDGLALVDATNQVIQFLSYEGIITAVDGPAAGQTSTDISIEETGSTPEGYSLQLEGEGQAYSAFTWQDASAATFGAINNNQSFGGEITGPDPEPEPEPEPTPENNIIFINEIHYDNNSSDVDEGVEIAGTAGTDLSGYSLDFYNGSASQLKVYKTENLSGTLPNLQNNYGTLYFPVSSIQNGDPDGIALVDSEGNVLQFLSYGGSFTPVDGPAQGEESTDIGVSESSSTTAGHSLQLTGEGSYYEDFTWAPEAANTFGSVNTAQTFLSPEPVLFVNEIHYDNNSSDSGEGVEVAGTAGLDLSGYNIVLYNGSASQLKEYKTGSLTGTIPNQQKGYGTLFFPISGIQNGDPDGVALVDPEGEVLQFLSYGGMFIPVDGPAAGMESSDIGVTESSATPAGFSLQLEGVGFNYEDFTWQEAIASTYGEVNTNQSFGDSAIDPEPEPEPTEPGTIAYARAGEVGTKLIIEGTLTVTDHHGNTAFIQDETGGIAIYGDMVTEKGKFNIGDSIRVTGTRAIYNELIQISELEEVEYLGVANVPIEPESITLSQLEDYRGQLVKITDMTFPDPGQLFFGNANYIVSDESGSAELRIDSDVESLVGKTQPETCEEVIGVVGRYNDINQLLPRNEADLPCAEEFNTEYPGSDISKELTFDAVTWNIEWFGDESNSPAAGNPDSDAVQKEAVKAVLLELNADVIAVMEISDEILFAEMISEMEGYNFVLSEATSYPDSPGGQKLGFIYKTETVDVTSSRPMFTSVHPFYEGDGSLLQDYPESPERFYASGRLPFLMEANVTLNGQTSEMKFVALHARANGSTGAQGRYDMRKYDVEVLKDSLDTFYPDDRVMILGDYNDDIDLTVANVSTTISTFKSYVQDNENYSIPTDTLSEQGYRSYAVGNYDDMIDHIMLTNELETFYIKGSARVHYEFYNSEFVYTTSDHFPVSVRLMPGKLQVSSIEKTGVLCSDFDTATATVYAEGGIPPYSYLWSNGQETQTATGFSAGTYSVEVTDALGNSATAEVTIEKSEAIEIIMEENKTVYIGYTSDCTTLGAASITGGTGSYSYKWSTGETTGTIEVCPDETTTYTLEVTDENGCTAEGTVTVTAEDVTCGNRGIRGNRSNRIEVCYKGKSFCLPAAAVPAFLRRGGKIGSCEGAADVLIEEVSAYPNPTRSNTTIKLTASKNAKGVLRVFNLRGNPLLSENVQITDGTTYVPLNLRNFRPGIYLVKIYTVDLETEALKILKF